MIDSPRRALRALLLVAWAGLCMAGTAMAYPDTPIRLVVPSAPGGGTDLIARTLGLEMSRDLGQPVIVDNRPGAGTMIGTDAVAKSAPDGYSVVVASFAHAVNPSLQPRLPYGSNAAFAPVLLIGRGPNVLVVRTDSPYKSVADVIAAAKAKPDTLTYASQGTGTSAHLAGEMFANLAKVRLVHIPYKGAGPALTDLLGGQIDFVIGTPGGTVKFVESGKMRAIAITSAERSPVFKDVPTIAETLPGYEADVWYALYAPGGTPPEVIARLNAAVVKAARASEFRQRVEAEGLSVATNTPREMTAFERAEEARWRQVIQQGRISTE